jgi:hypothetical protein
MALSYLDRVIKFRKLSKEEKLRCSVKEVYSSFLVIFNERGWKKQIRITYPDIQVEANLSLNAIKRAMMELKELGLIDYRSKQGSKYIFCCIDELFPDDTSYDDLAKAREKSRKKYTGTANPEEPEPTAAISVPEPKGGVIHRQPPSNDTYSPDGDHPPDDGIPRSWPELQRNLNELNIPPGDYQKIVQLSDYGRKGHPVWKAFHEISRKKGTKGAIERPGSWIQWYIKQAPPTATVPAAPAPSPPPEASGIPADRPPNDGAERDWDKLKSRLKELKCPPVAINRIAVLSGYGKLDSPVWSAVEEIRNKGDDIIQPGKWIIDYIRENEARNGPL